MGLRGIDSLSPSLILHPPRRGVAHIKFFCALLLYEKIPNIMAIEIERKFLVNGKPWIHAPYEAQKYIQGYLSLDRDRLIRVRCAKTLTKNPDEHNESAHDKTQQAWITIKGQSVGFSCREYEYPIPWEEGNMLLEHVAHTNLIKKIRHKIPFAQHTWDVDVFLAENAGLVMAEIELHSEAEHFEHPEWLGDEVTHEVRYKNIQLCLHPFSAWEEWEKWGTMRI